MVKYKYSALSKDGQKVSGIIDAFNELDAADRIKENCDVVLKLTEIKEEKGLLDMQIGKQKLNAKAFTVMCSQFANILRSGIPIGRTVKLIADKTTNKPLKKMLDKVTADVEAGRSISASFEEHGDKLLPPTFVETIRSGEESGNLDKAFETMYLHFDKQTKMKNKVKSALAYPAFVLVIAVVVVIVLMAKVVPTFTSIFDSYGADLPFMTRMLIAISDFFRKYYLIILSIMAAGFIFYKIYGNTEKGKMQFAKLALKIPVLGNIRILSAASQIVCQHDDDDARRGPPDDEMHSLRRKGNRQLLHKHGNVKARHQDTGRRRACRRDA
jgi:type IV pilus assembly protein PilC